MKRSNKKGFTIVELVIVIAVIAILAAVLIPTFINLTKKANESVDMQLVRNLNTIVSTHNLENGGVKTMHDAIVAISENGYALERLSTSDDENTVAWDGGNSCFVLLKNEDQSVIYPENLEKDTSNANIFILSDTYPVEGTFSGFAAYLTSDYSGTNIENATTGVDVGYHDDITVSYKGSDEVIIRTNSFIYNFSMPSGTTGTVNHYGKALNALVESGTYNCFAELAGRLYQNGEKPTGLFSGGDGTKESPYLITSGDQIANIAQCVTTKSDGTKDNVAKGYFKLLCDVTYEGGILDVTYFAGELDGNGHELTFKKTDSSWPSLFQYSYNATIKNLVYNVDTKVHPLFAYLTGSTTFENVTATSSTSEIISTWGYGASAFCYCVYSDASVYFKNCANKINFTITEGSYGGIFIGNFALPNSYLSFENCINKGTVSGANVGFFIGNDVHKINLTDSSAPKFDSDSVLFYISQCKNEGALLGTSSVSAFGCNGSSGKESNNAANEKLTNSQFSRGSMLVSNTKISLKSANNNTSFSVSDAQSVAKYIVSFSCYANYTQGGGTLSISTELTPEQISSWTHKRISQFIDRKSFEASGNTFTSNGKTSDGRYDYMLSNTSDGSQIVVIDFGNEPNYDHFSGKVYFSVSAYDSNNLMVGYNVLRIAS